MNSYLLMLIHYHLLLLKLSALIPNTSLYIFTAEQFHLLWTKKLEVSTVDNIVSILFNAKSTARVAQKHILTLQEGAEDGCSYIAPVQRRSHSVNIGFPAALQLPSGEPIKLASRQDSASGSYCLLQCSHPPFVSLSSCLPCLHTPRDICQKPPSLQR